MKKVLFFLSAVVIAALTVVACQKDNTLIETLSVPAQVDQSSDRSDCTNMVFTLVNYGWAAGNYARVIYTKPDNSTGTLTLTTVGSSAAFSIKAGTTIDIKHKLTNSAGYFVISRLTNNDSGVTKYYKYHNTNTSGSAVSYVCQQTNCSLPDQGTCDCANVPDTDPTNTPDYWCN